MCQSNFLIFVTSKLLGAKIKKSKSNKIHIYIYNEKSLYIFKIYGLKNM